MAAALGQSAIYRMIFYFLEVTAGTVSGYLKGTWLDRVPAFEIDPSNDENNTCYSVELGNETPSTILEKVEKLLQERSSCT